eukprot:gnl/TRDRNA2_/TRDRNA2_180837_c0_seq1.p1 gnl/TRDRNA2_/TRDRNA2_180837_c0~~gnl/TRDRNA2_/TRDRNA2_180837_c0_seq1.p1  ORF type:complete len:810 (+),score=192.09 gnl/TRDRNA2_/TRDRNA2_180837_c0_seq1:65-2494(+)
MMRAVSAIVLHALTVQALAADGTDDRQARLLEKALEMSSQQTPLDGTVLGKTSHLGVARQPSPLASSSRSSLVPPSSLFPLARQQSGQTPFRKDGMPGRRDTHRMLPQSHRAPKFEASFAAPSRQQLGHVARATATAETEGETLQYQAEVGRIMDIIVNSIYSDRDVFLRELISNSADACEKKRFVALTEKNEPTEDLKIFVRSDKDANTLYIEDNGMGMTKEELIENLGRIARSGTAKFTEMMKQKDGGAELIGQFGVGFYSSFLVADQVTVTTRSFNQTGNTIYQWQSVPGDFGNYKLKEVPAFEGGSGLLEGMSSGTQIALKLKDDAGEYIESGKQSSLLQKYSEFIPFPINLWKEKTEYVQVPDGNKTNEDGSVKMKSEPKQTMDWTVMNTNKPLWLRDPSSVNESDYTEFYTTTFKAFDEPLGKIHFSVEGNIEFRALLFFPEMLPFEFNQNMFAESGRAMRLYVKRVFINDKFEDIVPRWLTFLRGVVDSDDLPLNVGREILQKSKTLTVIRKNVVRKVLNFVEDLSEKQPEKFNKLWDTYGRYFKVGMIEDRESKDAIKKIVRYWSSQSGDNTTTLGGYVSRMQEGQGNIYYVTGDGRKSAEMAPTMEKMKAKNLEVLYLVDPLDEITIEQIGTFEDKKFVDINKGDLDLGDTEEEKQKQNQTQTEFEPLLKWMKTTLGDEKVKEVKLSTRLTDSPAVLVQAQWGMSPTMQRYMRAQASARGEEDKMSQAQMMNNPIFEINAEHPMIQQLKESFTTDPGAPEVQDLANLIFEIAALTGGYRIDDPAAFAKRVTGLVTKTMKS